MHYFGQVLPCNDFNDLLTNGEIVQIPLFNIILTIRTKTLCETSKIYCNTQKQ